MRTSHGLLTVIAIFLSAGVVQAETLGYQAWRQSRVDDARTTLEKVSPVGPPEKRKLIELKKARPEQARDLVRLQSQAQLNLEIAQELTVNDYFVLYLSQQRGRDAFLEAAKKLTPDEMADLMLAYQRHLTGSQEIEVPTSTGAGLGTTASAAPRSLK